MLLGKYLFKRTNNTFCWKILPDFLNRSYSWNTLHTHTHLNCSSYTLLTYLHILLDATVLCLVVQSCLTLCEHMDYSPPGSSVHGDSAGKNTRVGCHALQGIFPTQGSNAGLLYCRWILYRYSHQGSPTGLETHRNQGECYEEVGSDYNLSSHFCWFLEKPFN